MLKDMKPFKTDAIPRVLLIGNGINRAFNSSDWDKLIQDMAQNDRKEETLGSGDFILPFDPNLTPI